MLSSYIILAATAAQEVGETLGEGLIEWLHDRLGKRFGEMLCEMLDSDMLKVHFRQASSRIQDSLNLSQLPSPDEGLVF